jgi:hypothetical protein
MAPPKSPRRVNSGAAGVDGNQHKIQNLILLTLPVDEMQAAAAKLEFVELPTHSVLHEAGESVMCAYFIIAGWLRYLT